MKRRVVRKGIESSKREVAACFLPRHGVRVTKPDKSFDLVVCFECRQLKLFDGGESTLLTSNEVEPAVNAFYAARLK